MKYLAKSLNNKMVQIGEDIKKGKWFYISEEITPVVDTLVVGEEVTFVSEPRGGAYYLTFLAKGNVTIPEQYAKKSEPVANGTPVSLPQPTKTYNSSPQGGTGVSYKREEKVDWDSKERRDFRGRSLAYATSAMSHLIPANMPFPEEEYLKILFSVAKKLEEYIYSK